MPIRMIYQPTSIEKGIEIDVYNFHQLDENLECFVTGWVVKDGYWLTVPLHTIHPKTAETKKKLNETQ